MAELDLVDGASVGLFGLDLSVLGVDFGLREFEGVDLVEHGFGVVEVDCSTLV